MSEQNYIGIDKTDNNEWIAVLWNQGKSVFSRPFKNTPRELQALVQFITDRCQHPKICVNPTSPNVFALIQVISAIQGVEVVLMSNAGLKLHLDWLPKDSVAMPFQTSGTRRAYLLACCAERII